jgi:hypothetical protein
MADFRTRPLTGNDNMPNGAYICTETLEDARWMKKFISSLHYRNMVYYRWAIDRYKSINLN